MSMYRKIKVAIIVAAVIFSIVHIIIVGIRKYNKIMKKEGLL